MEPTISSDASPLRVNFRTDEAATPIGTMIEDSGVNRSDLSSHRAFKMIAGGRFSPVDLCSEINRHRFKAHCYEKDGAVFAFATKTASAAARRAGSAEESATGGSSGPAFTEAPVAGESVVSAGCSFCGKTGSSLQGCGGGCNPKASYCNKDCQKSHWKTHKKTCPAGR